MRSIGYGGIAGNVNLKGKKSRMMLCRCCWAEDLKTDYIDQLAIKEMKEEATEWHLKRT